MNNVFRAILNDPQWVLTGLEGDNATFHLLDRHISFGSRGINKNIIPAHRFLGSVTMPTLCAADHDWEYRPINYIYHISYGGSSLLAKLLDIPGINVSFNEPIAFASTTDEQFIKLFSRPIVGDEQCTIKTCPGDIRNAYIHLARGEKAILLYQPLHKFINSLYKDAHRYDIVYHFYHDIIHEDPSQANLVTMGVRMWEFMMHEYQEVINQYPNARTLNSDRLYNDPHTTLRKVYDHFNMDVSDELLNAKIEKDMSTHSKFEFDFNTKDREAQEQEYAEKAAQFVAKYRDLINKVATLTVGGAL